MRDWVRLRAVGKGAEKLFDEGKAYTDLIYVGKWIQHGIGFRCSECNIGTSESNVKAGLMNFCPNCGADMREER